LGRKNDKKRTFPSKIPKIIMKGFKDSNNKFHPISQSKRVRSRRDTKKNQGVRLKRKLVLMRNPTTQNDKNHILSSVLGSNAQFKKEAGETEAELWFTAKVQLKRRGWQGKVNRKEFDKWLALERQKRYKHVRSRRDKSLGILRKARD